MFLAGILQQELVESCHLWVALSNKMETTRLMKHALWTVGLSDERGYGEAMGESRESGQQVTFGCLKIGQLNINERSR